MTSEELAMQAQNGNQDAILKLWEQNRRLAWKFLNRWRRTAELAGLTTEDLEQTAFLALLKAVGYFDKDSNFRFSTYFSRCVQNELASAAGTRTERQQREPLKYAASLDVPISPDAPDLTLAELIPDPSAVSAFERAETSGSLTPFLESLPENQQSALYHRYWLDLPLDKAELKAHAAALKALRHPNYSRKLRALL